MPKIKEKTTGFYFKCSPEDMAFIEKRMEQTGIRNKSAFIRKMCIDGHVFTFDSPTLREISKLLRITSNNANQLARGVNSGYGAPRNDVTAVNDNLTEIRTQFGDLLDILSEITNPAPGKRFIMPLRYSDLKNLPDNSLSESADDSTTEENPNEGA
ncbi:MAG: MobC family plasmid mobilization relaxosome protein [Defluviitaleaceae bacterium]|nr:MobC family plasmid mobilization relaxosome protein [Defluviitaleaceae bacterium]